jgi:transcriptional regulator with XRE-family HTH domain
MSETGLGLALKTLRERRTLSVREMGKLADVDHAYIYRLESGEKTNPSSDMLAKLIKVLRAEEREADIVRWLGDHETNPELVKFAIDDPSIDLTLFTMAAGARHRGGGRPDVAALFARCRRALDFDDED